MQLTSFTDYGLRSLIYLAGHPDRKCSVKEISEFYNISRNHLVKVIHKLSLLGLIESSKGKGGGLILAADPAKLRLGDMVVQLEPTLDLVECFSPEKNTCRIAPACQLKHYLADANKAFIASLNQHTLADVMANRLELFPPIEAAE